MNAREVALAAVRDVFPNAGTRERGAQEALDYRLQRSDLDGRNRAFATELAYGSIKMRRTLDWYLEPFVGARRAELPPVVLEVLRLGIYELAYTRADEHATVFEFVNLAKKYGHRGVANLVNAVLRSFLRDRPAAPQRDDFADEDEYLGTRYSLPTWLVRTWRGTFGPTALEQICSGVDDPAQSAASLDTGTLSRAALAERFGADGIASRPSAFAEDSLLVDDAAYLRAHEGAAGGAWWIQAESAALPAAVLGPQPGEAVLDLCCGRGNKTMQIVARLRGEGSVVCVDSDARKCELVERRAASAGMPVAVVAGDATRPILPPGQIFDRVLVDAPCSGIGVVGRHAEARWKKRPDDGARLAATQAALLQAAAGWVRPGGALVYAVCSNDPRETSAVIASFVQRNPFSRGLVPSAFESLADDAGDVIVPPGIDGRDGFYIARLDRSL